VTTTRWTLTEYRTTAGVPLDEGVAAWLRRVVPELEVRPSWNEPGHYDLTPGSHVGLVSTSNLAIVILPKVPVERVLFLMSFAIDPVRWQAHASDYADATDLTEGMAAIFAHTLRRALRRGLVQGYRVLDDALMTVRGRIRFDDQLRARFDTPLPIEVTFDDFTADTDLNRLLLAALNVLRRLPLRSQSLRSTLSACAAAFADTVTARQYAPSALPKPTWNRLNLHFRPAAELAAAILRSTSLELDHGETRGTALTVDMNLVFETFLRSALRQALDLDPSSWPDRAPRWLALDRASCVRLEPDLTWWDAGHCRFVGDAKYKHISAAGVKHADLYQLLAYTTALGVENGMLVYAAGEATDVEHVVRLAGKRLLVRTLDIDGTPATVLRRVAELSEAISELATPRGTGANVAVPHAGSTASFTSRWAGHADSASDHPQVRRAQTPAVRATLR
jgi:5-methylcytosine-specific restriction enzyme subunit McrC